MTELITTFVPVAFIEVVQDRLAKFVKSMRKRGLPEPVLSLGITEKRKNCHAAHVHDHKACPDVMWQQITLSGETPRFNGWRLIASVDNVEGKPIFRTVPGESVPESQYGIDPQHCDHCKTRRYRTETFIIGHEDGRLMQIGRQCIRDFLGWDVGPIVAYFEFIQSMADEPEGGFGSYLRPSWDPKSIIRVACDVVSVTGFYRKSTEDDSTKGTVLDIINPPSMRYETSYREWQHMVEEYTSNPDRSQALYDATMAAIPTLDVTRSEWAYNVKTLASAERIETKHVGILASAVILGLRALEDQVRREVEKRQPSSFIGNVGDKITFDATLNDERVTQSYYGTSILYTFGASGDIVKWFSSKDLGLTKGHTYRVTGTVKKHETYREQRSTLITRAKVESIG